MKRFSINISRPALTDIGAIIDWYQDEAGEVVAERFRDAIDRTVLAIAANPQLGTLVGSPRKDLTGIRKRAVVSFPRYLVFHLLRGDKVEVIRVLHSSQDWWTEFEVA